MHAFDIIFAHELATVYPLMCVLGTEFNEEVRAKCRSFERLFPGNAHRCVLCRQPHGCGCIAEPLLRERARSLSVPVAVSAAGTVVAKLRAVNRATRAAWRECRAHVGMTARIAQYRTDAHALAYVRAAHSVVGRGVHCHVGECSRCHGNIQECGCSMFTCECRMCIWKRRMRRSERPWPGEDSANVGLRIPTVDMDAVAPPGTISSDLMMFEGFRFLRNDGHRDIRLVVMHADVAADQAARGYDAGLNSDDGVGVDSSSDHGDDDGGD